MIARIWRGRVRRGKADEYVRFLRERAIPDYRSVEGNRGAFVLRRDVSGDETSVITLSFWESIRAIERFAGADYAVAKYYPEDDAFLLDFPEHVEHYELFDTVE